MIDVGTHTLSDGRTVEVVEIAGGGLRARVAGLGAALLALWVPDATGGAADLALGHDELAGYVDDDAFLGVAVGPVAGRIGGARIKVDGETHRLDANDGANTLHSGPAGLHAVVWDIADRSASSVELATVHADGAGGFPGDLAVRLRYTLAEGALPLDWTATTTAPTPVAPTHHGYLHLDGHDAGSVRPLVVRSPCDTFVPIRPDSVPVGELAPVAGTPFDLRQPVTVGAILDADHSQVARANGLDHDLLTALAPARQLDLRPVLTVRGATRRLDIWTTEPAVHLYAGGYLGVNRGKGGARYDAHGGLAIETQPPPDALAHDAFPDTVLWPGDTFRSATVYGFAAAHPTSG